MPRGARVHRHRLDARAVCWLAAACMAQAWLGCGDTTRDGDGAGGDGATASSAGGEGATSGAGGAPATSAQSGSGAEQTCDDLGFCGEADDPGCVTCSISEGPCIEEYQACVGECQALRACYAACDEDDQSCLTECNGDHPQGIADLDTLFGCILCEGCPVSCNFDTASCP
jgi:hypothetical protein